MIMKNKLVSKTKKINIKKECHNKVIKVVLENNNLLAKQE